MRRHLLVAASLLATSFAYFLLAAHPFNWTGGDEWGGLDLASQGIVSCSHCKRICLIYNWLAYQLWPGTLWGFRIFGAFALWGGGLALYAIGRRLFPRQRFVPMTWAVFYVVFLTRDYVKLFPVYTATYACSVTVALWAIALYAESWVRRSWIWLAAALAVDVLAVWSYETSIPLLLLPPAVLVLVAPWNERRTIAWVGAWYAVLALAALRYALPMLEAGGTAYQRMYSPLPLHRWPHAFELQLLRHFSEVGQFSPGALVEHWVAAIVTLGASVPLLILAFRDAVASTPAEDRASLGAALVLGFVALVAGVAPYTVLFGGYAGRAHYYSTPAAALMLVAALALAVSFAGARWRGWIIASSWLVFVVISTVSSAHHRYTFWWDRQTALLRRLTDLVPATRPETLIVLLEPPTDPSFRHPTAFYSAVRYLYGPGTTGISDSTEQVLLDVEYLPGEIHIVPKAWAASMSIREARFPLDRVILVAETLQGNLSIAADVPARFGGTAGKRYAPDARIEHAGGESHRRILELAALPRGEPLSTATTLRKEEHVAASAVRDQPPQGFTIERERASAVDVLETVGEGGEAIDHPVEGLDGLVVSVRGDLDQHDGLLAP